MKSRWSKFYQIIKEKNLHSLENFIFEKQLLESNFDESGFCILHVLIGSRWIEGVKKCLEMKSDVNMTTEKNLTPIAFELMNKNRSIEMIKLLIHHKADLNLNDNDSLFAFHHLLLKPQVNKGSEEIIKLLVKSKSDCNIICGSHNPFYLLLDSPFATKEMILFFLENGADINQLEVFQQTRVMGKIEFDLDLIKIFVEHKMDLR